jgi:TolB-like protein
LLTVGAVSTVWTALLSAQCPDGSPPPCAGRTRGPAPNSVAVLTFSGAPDDTALQWLGNGLAEEIATELGSAPGVVVRGAGIVRSAQQVAGGDPRRVSQLVNVRYIVEGSYRRAGNGVRVSVRLLELPGGSQQWGHVYDRARDSLTTIADAIAGDVSRALGHPVALPGRPARSTDPLAQEAYQRGRFSFVHADIPAAAAFFREAVTRDSLFAAAWAGVAITWAERADYELAPMEAYPRAREAARRALALDSSQSDAWVTLAYDAAALDFDCSGGMSLIARAMALDSLKPEAWVVRSGLLLCLGRTRESTEAMRTAWGLDTLSGYTAGYYLFNAAVYEPDSVPSLVARLGPLLAVPERTYWEGRVAMQRGDCAAATRALRPLAETNLADQYVAALVCLGARARADSVVRALVADTSRRYVNPVMLASASLELGDTDAAIRWFERGITDRTFWVVVYPRNRGFAPLQHDPRFVALLARIGIPVVKVN